MLWGSKYTFFFGRNIGGGKKVKKEEMTREEETIFFLSFSICWERCFSSVLQHLRRHSVMFALPVQKSALAFLVHP